MLVYVVLNQMHAVLNQMCRTESEVLVYVVLNQMYAHVVLNEMYAVLSQMYAHVCGSELDVCSTESDVWSHM